MNYPLSPLERFEAGGFRWSLAPDLRARLFDGDGLRLPEWLATGQARPVKQGPHRVVYRVDLPGLPFYLKHNLVPDMARWLRQVVRRSKARLEYECRPRRRRPRHPHRLPAGPRRARRAARRDGREHPDHAEPGGLPAAQRLFGRDAPRAARAAADGRAAPPGGRAGPARRPDSRRRACGTTTSTPATSSSASTPTAGSSFS